MPDFDIAGLFSNRDAKLAALFSVRPSCVRVRGVACRCQALTRENCDRLVWKFQSFASESEGCLLDIFRR